MGTFLYLTLAKLLVYPYHFNGVIRGQVFPHIQLFIRYIHSLNLLKPDLNLHSLLDSLKP